MRVSAKEIEMTVSIGDWITALNGAQAEVMGIFPSGRLDVEIKVVAGCYKMGDRLVWMEPGVERLDVPPNDHFGIPIK